MSAKISLIVPVFNGKDIIDRCLESIASQSVDNLEVIIVDDGSSDGSADYIREWIDKYDTKGFDWVVETKPNGGIADARNHGIKLATGDYLMFADHDDYFDKDYLAKYLSAITSSESEVVVGGYERVKSDGEVIRSCKLTSGKWSKFLVLAPWAHIYDARFIKDNDITFLDSPIGEDVYFNILAYANASSVKTIDDTRYKWFYNEASVSNSHQNTIKDDVDPLYLLDSIYKGLEGLDFRNNALCEYFFFRYICWYMLFSSKGSKKTDIVRAYDRLHNWMIDHYPNYLESPYIGRKCPRGEDINIARAVGMYYRLHKLGLAKPILKVLGVR